MAFTFNDMTQIDRRDDIVFDFAQEGEFPPIRVQASRQFVENFWNIDWDDEGAVRSKFDHEKRKHVGVLKRAEGRVPALRIYILG
jgi:hypothetical protein